LTFLQEYSMTQKQYISSLDLNFWVQFLPLYSMRPSEISRAERTNSLVRREFQATIFQLLLLTRKLQFFTPGCA
jgi:hypothetical protein